MMDPSSSFAVPPPEIRRPSRAWYALTALPGTFAIIVLVWFIADVINSIGGMQRFVIPGEHVLSLDRGFHTLHVETRSVIDGVEYDAPTSEVRCTLVEVNSGRAVALETPSGHSSYTLPDHEGQGLFDLEAPTSGSYRLSCESDDKAVLAIGGAFQLGNVLILVLALALALPLTGIIGYLVHRSRDLKRLARS